MQIFPPEGLLAAFTELVMALLEALASGFKVLYFDKLALTKLALTCGKRAVLPHADVDSALHVESFVITNFCHELECVLLRSEDGDSLKRSPR